MTCLFRRGAERRANENRANYERAHENHSKQEPATEHRALAIRSKRAAYAMPTDFCRMFEDQVDGLYTLALLLTGDPMKADVCFVAGLDDCVRGGPVFREWARSWAKRMVIKNAIRIIAPSGSDGESAVVIPFSESNAPVAVITRMQPLDRFVFVLSVLEGYPDRECSLLLSCPVEEVAAARARALQRLAAVAGRKGSSDSALGTMANQSKPFYGAAS
jgi:hypothetical protein